MPRSIIDQLTDEAVASVLPKLRERIRADIARSLGTAEALQRNAKPRARRQAKVANRSRKVDNKIRKVANAAPKRGKRSRTSADVVAKQKQEVLDACIRTARTMQWFKRSDIQSKIEDSSIDVGRMLALNVDSADLVKRGDRRQSEYRLAAKHKTNGATPRTVDRSETQEVGDGSV